MSTQPTRRMPTLGEKVTIRSWEEMEKEFGLASDGSIICKQKFTKSMREYCGKTFTVTHVYNDSFRLDEGSWWSFNPSMIEPLPPLPVEGEPKQPDLYTLCSALATTERKKEALQALFAPDPYVPEKWDKCLMRDTSYEFWRAEIFSRYDEESEYHYRTPNYIGFRLCRPFDPELVGKVTPE